VSSLRLTPKMKPIARNRSKLVAALDVGTSKIVCVIGRLKPLEHVEPSGASCRRSHAVEVIGISHTFARGVKSGSVVDLAEVEQAVRHCVDLAERMAAVQLESVIVSLSAGRPGSELFHADVDVSGEGRLEVFHASPQLRLSCPEVGYEAPILELSGT